MPDLTLATPEIHLSARATATIHELAAKEGKSAETVLDEAVEEYRRELFFREFNEAFARLQADPVAWADYQAEQRLWDSALMDGLEEE